VTQHILDPDVSAPVRPGLCALGVMTKAPKAGKVKTRLVPPLTGEEAAALNICFLGDITASIDFAVKNGDAMGIAVYTPVGSEDSYEGILPDTFLMVPQRGEGFGERLLFAAEDLFRLGFTSVCLINSDSPTVPSQVFVDAVENLARSGDRVVLGPSDDGGYYLIGLKKLHRRLFQEIDWSTEKVLQQTMDRARTLNLDVHLLQSWFDVDDRMSLQRLCREILDQSSNQHAPATERFLRELVANRGRNQILPNE
jgi:uncharacterized protein